LCLGENGKYVLERLFELGDKLLAVKSLPRVPANLASNKDEATGGLDTIRIADRRPPSIRK
jgi:hypothetical protein